MAKFGFKSKKEKQIEQLDKEIDRERENYERKAKNLNVEIEKKSEITMIRSRSLIISETTSLVLK